MSVTDIRSFILREARLDALNPERSAFAAQIHLMAESLYWRCSVCGYKQLRSMDCYCPTFEAMRREWAASQNIPTVEAE